jgi:CO/xanthine dehydrogenase Mo-binding subunit
MTQSIIGQSIKRIDAFDKVTGETLYPGDRTHSGELWLKVLFARRPHARVVTIDPSEAEALPGVVAVITAKDVPVNEYGLQISDQPVLCGPGSAKEGADIVRFVGDQVAVVIAESEKIAARARRLITVEYEDLPLIDDPVFAMSDQAVQLYPDKPNNIAYHKRVRKGSPAAAWTDCDLIIEGVCQTPYQEHAYLQPEAGTAYIDDEGRITVHCAGQWTWEDQHQIAHALNLAPEKVRVVYDAIGGAFGGREDMSVQIILALAVFKLDKQNIRRPVKIIWSREESMIGHCKRHPMTIKSKWGAKADGTLVAAEIEVICDAGSYMYTTNKVLGNTIVTVTGPYEFPHVKLDAYGVYTNNIVGGAYRGFGGPQGHFAAEMQMNKLAEKLGLDPVEIRLKNVLTADKLLSVGTPIPGGVSLEQVIRQTAQQSNWIRMTEPRGEYDPDSGEMLPPEVVGRGFAAGFKNVGFSLGYQENSWAEVELQGGAEIEEAIVRFAGADVGQGHHTVMLQIAAEALQLDFDKVKAEVSDTSFTQSSGSASASRLTFMAGNAIKKAAELALQKWEQEERPAVAEATWLAPKTTSFDPETGYATPSFAYGYVAQMAEITVNTENGFITVNRIVCADDVGKAINPEQVIGQIEGAIVQAHGYTILEDFQVDKGQVLNPNFSTYLIPGVYDIPEQVDSIIVEDPHPDGPYGVRGMAEMPYLPYAAVIASAVFDATGVWFDEFPLTPERVLRGLGKVRDSNAG